MIQLFRNLFSSIDLLLIKRRADIGRAVRWSFPIIVVAPHLLEIDDQAFIGENVKLDASGGIKIGAHSLIAAGVFITSRSHLFDSLDKTIRSQGYNCSQVVVGEDVWIGNGVKVLPGVTIGSGSVVGAGSVVTKNIPPYSVWAGVPARFIRKRGK